MQKIILHLFNILSLLLPFTSFFQLKHFLLRKSGVVLGNNVRICGRTHFMGDGDVSIGKDTWVGMNNSFYRTSLGSIKIGQNCDIAPEVSFIPGSHELGDSKRRAGIGSGGDIEIGDGCWIGIRATILGGVRVGSGSVIAAGSLVLKDVPENCLVAGVPAVVKKVFQYEE